MSILSRFLQPPDVSDAQIIDAISPWMLACAVGAANGSLGTRIGFDMWLRLSGDNWIPGVAAATGFRAARIERALRSFVAQQGSKNYAIVLRELEQTRGKEPSVVIGPGETYPERP